MPPRVSSNREAHRPRGVNLFSDLTQVGPFGMAHRHGYQRSLFIRAHAPDDASLAVAGSARWGPGRALFSTLTFLRKISVDRWRRQRSAGGLSCAPTLNLHLLGSCPTDLWAKGVRARSVLIPVGWIGAVPWHKRFVPPPEMPFRIVEIHLVRDDKNLSHSKNGSHNMVWNL